MVPTDSWLIIFQWPSPKIILFNIFSTSIDLKKMAKLNFLPFSLSALPQQ